MDGFTGALPAGQVRQFLDKHVPSAGALAAQEEVDEADALLDAGDTQAALAKLADALAQDPANDTARADYAYLLIASGQLNEADTVLQEPPGCREARRWCTGRCRWRGNRCWRWTPRPGRGC